MMGGMSVGLGSALSTLRHAVADLEPRLLTGDDALEALRVLAEIERIAAACRLDVARRVDDANVWRSTGDRSAAHLVARETGTAVGTAAAALDTARRLDRLPDTKQAFAAGLLSEAQAREVASAAETPEQEARLLQAAATQSLTGLRTEAQVVRAANHPERLAGLRARRSCRTWTDQEGFFRLDARLAPDDGARVRAVLDAHRAKLFSAAHAAGEREAFDAYTADALVAAVASGGDVRAELVVRCDLAPLRAGHVHDGEVCEIPGVGPVPLQAAIDVLGTAFLKLVITDGVDVRNVVHLGRRATAVQRTALLERDGYRCARCGNAAATEIDHIEGWAVTHATELDDLQLLCRFDHSRKSRAERCGRSP